METITMDVLNPFPVLIGHEGENNVEQVIFDYSAWAELYGAGVLNMVILRPLEHLAYPVILTDNGDQTATWTISEADTATVGTGRAQLVYYPTDGNKKSCVFDICVGESIFPDGDVPDDYESWLNTLMEIGAAAQQAAIDAGQSATDASGSADAAEQSASDASGFAQNASDSADSASDSAQTAQQAAETAGGSAESASLSARSAAQSAQNASGSASAASGSAQSAAQSAQAASQSAEAASDSATAADRSAQDAQASAEQAAETLNTKVTGPGLTLSVTDGLAVLTY